MEKLFHEILNVLLGIKSEIYDNATANEKKIRESIVKITIEGQNNNSAEAITVRKTAESIFRFLENLKP